MRLKPIDADSRQEVARALGAFSRRRRAARTERRARRQPTDPPCRQERRRQMQGHGFTFLLWLVLFGFTACGPSLLERRMEIDKATPGDCPRADTLVEEYARAGVAPSEVRSARGHVNAVCASEAYTQGDLEHAAARAQRALEDEPGNALAQDILNRVAERHNAGPPPPVR